MNWKKKFWFLPRSIRVELQRIESEFIKVRATKSISIEDVAAGTYAHLGLTLESLKVGQNWKVVPPVSVGTTSKRNNEGWTVTRKDLPKHQKYFYRDIPVFGDPARKGWNTVPIPRELYETDTYPPYLFQIEVSLYEALNDNHFCLIFSINEVFSKYSANFTEDLLFAVNLLQENTGVSAVETTENPSYLFTSPLRWNMFPPEQITNFAIRIHKSHDSEQSDLPKITRLLVLFAKFQPIEYLEGVGGNDYYFGAKYADDLVVLENVHHKDILYIIYDDWTSLSEKPKYEILKLPISKFDRLIRSDGWENRFAALMQHQLKERGLRTGNGGSQKRRHR